MTEGYVELHTASAFSFLEGSSVPEELVARAAALNIVPASTGAAKAIGLVLPWCNTEAMNAHLAEIAMAVNPGAHAILIVDQAGWHTTAKLRLPENITILPLPPKSPELNPVENVWQFIRENWLSNRIFESYDQIVDLCCDAWNKLRDQPWRIMSIGLRDWAHA